MPGIDCAALERLSYGPEPLNEAAVSKLFGSAFIFSNNGSDLISRHHFFDRIRGIAVALKAPEEAQRFLEERERLISYLVGSGFISTEIGTGNIFIRVDASIAHHMLLMSCIFLEKRSPAWAAFISNFKNGEWLCLLPNQTS